MKTETNAGNNIMPEICNTPTGTPDIVLADGYWRVPMTSRIADIKSGRFKIESSI